MLNPWDKVKIIDWYYQWQEWHIEGMKEGQFIIALQNDNWCVNTVMPAKRLEIINNTIDKEKVLKQMEFNIIKLSYFLAELDKCLISLRKSNLQN